ncbi:hypothetical protein SMICM304S_06781 [Streptomyces microflavus]
MTSVSGGNTAWVLYVDSTIGASGVQAITGKAIRSVHLGMGPHLR